jgi:hypothetical protein
LRSRAGLNPKSTRRSLREETMKYIHAMLAVVCLLVVGGAIGAVRADDQENQSVTLYTPVIFGDIHYCIAVDVSDKTLGIIVELIDPQGQALSCDSPNTCADKSGTLTTTNPTPEFQILPGTGNALLVTLTPGRQKNSYCAVAVSGTDNRDDVRVSLVTTITRTIPGTTIPDLLTRVVEGH